MNFGDLLGPRLGSASRSNPVHDPFQDERRNATRFVKEPGMDFATIVQPDALAGTVEVYDESLGGLGLILDDVASLRVGQALQVVYAGALVRGTIRHITLRDDGRYVVGICCS
jgi:hypothetical protein